MKPPPANDPPIPPEVVKAALSLSFTFDQCEKAVALMMRATGCERRQAIDAIGRYLLERQAVRNVYAAATAMAAAAGDEAGGPGDDR